jgi:hypothetical protein
MEVLPTLGQQASRRHPTSIAFDALFEIEEQPKEHQQVETARRLQQLLQHCN